MAETDLNAYREQKKPDDTIFSLSHRFGAFLTKREPNSGSTGFCRDHFPRRKPQSGYGP